MKKILLIFLSLFYLATTFRSDNPPGWYQQALPVNDVVKDISFVDSLNGWIITEGNFNNQDTGYIMSTTNGGVNWSIQYDTTETFNVIQFVDENVGYAGGGFGRASFYRTTDGGENWQYSAPFGSTFYSILDLQYVNKDTGWVCSDDSFGGGVFKTTNGGLNWIRQTLPNQLRPIKLFFINQDTGWALNNANNSIYKTTNSGSNWFFLNNIGTGLKDLFFLSNDTGWIIRGVSTTDGILKTTNAGINWFIQSDPYQFGSGPQAIYILKNNKGWIGTGFNKILALFNDSTWGRQNTPLGFNSYGAIMMIDTTIGYAGGGIMIKTDDGGGIITNLVENSQNVPEQFTLFQNYPNPFNPKTIIRYNLTNSGIVRLKVFDINGKEINEIINQRQNPGEYEIDFNGAEFPTGVYFYRLEVIEDRANKVLTETKSMLLIK